VSTRTRRLIGLALTAVITAASAAPAAADDLVDAVIDDLDAVTERIARVTNRADRRMHADWDRAVAVAVNTASLNRLESTLASSRVNGAAALSPLIGEQSIGVVPVAITAALWDEDMNFVERRDHTDTLVAWFEFRGAISRAEALRDTLREHLGLPPIEGLRVCPLEEADIFEDDWGDQRGWWRTHKGTDINAAEGTRLVAMERGEVIQMGWHYLGGNGLYVLGAVTGDVYYYAHLSSYADDIEVGSFVEAGQVVAYVGDTGNSDIPHLHLGWMPGAGAVDLDELTDAYPMLVELCL
jgi:murein DD-endopeptidase MepM/ murein hydrolase activator NlpD